MNITHELRRAVQVNSCATRERCSSQASAIWLGVATWLWAIRASGEFGLASLPAANGYQGIKAMPAPAHISISPSDDLSRRL